MGAINTNDSTLSFTKEASLGVLGANPVWTQIERESLGDFGGDIATVQRNPVSRDRQRRDGTITDFNSAVTFDTDWTLSEMENFLSAAIQQAGYRTNTKRLAVTAISATNDDLTIAALPRAIAVNELVKVVGAGNPANNGVFEVATAASAADTSLEITNANAANESALTTAFASLVGYRIASGTTGAWTWAAGSRTATLAVTGLGTTLTAAGFVPGSKVSIGSINRATMQPQNAMEDSAANDTYGYAVIESISADQVVFKSLTPLLQKTISDTSGGALDIMQDCSFRNVPVDDATYLLDSYQFELDMPGLAANNVDSVFEYAIGNYLNTMTFNVPITDKGGLSYAFVGQDTNVNIAQADRRSTQGAYLLPQYDAALNTSQDIARLRVADVDDNGITTDFTALSLQINNNITPQKVLGFLGSKFINVGNFEVNVTATMIFSSDTVIERIRNNTSVTMDFDMRNEDGLVGISIPTMNLGGGARQFNRGEKVQLNFTGAAHGDNEFNSSIHVSIISEGV